MPSRRLKDSPTRFFNLLRAVIESAGVFNDEDYETLEEGIRELEQMVEERELHGFVS